MLASYLDSLRLVKPLVHCIVNHVTANDCANLVLACGASPIMAEDAAEAAEVTSFCRATVLNLGIPSPEKIKALVAAGKMASTLGHPTVFDPVGAGVSQLRRDGAARILEQVRPTVIRGNADEIATLLLGSRCTSGVDAGTSDEAAHRQLAMELAASTGAVVVLSGRTDIVTDGVSCFRVHNGSPVMRAVTGTGCQLSCLVGSFLAASPDEPLQASLAAVCAMGLCGQQAQARLRGSEGNATYRNYIIDAVYHLTGEELERGACYEIS